jgi:hypothetical protein
MNSSDLETLRRFLAEISRVQVRSLSEYWDSTSNGFRHEYRGESKLSKASTGTCVLSLTAAASYEETWRSRAAELAVRLLHSDWSSAGLPPDNVFTTSFILETVSALEAVAQSFSYEIQSAVLIVKAENILSESLKTGEQVGAAQLQNYPPSAYLTQLVVRVLKRRNRLDVKSEKNARAWALREMTRQLALSLSGAKMADVYSLAYSTIIFASLSKSSDITPDEAWLIQKAVGRIFDSQLESGSWPYSRPLFHYPRIGSAYCYEYEMLVQLLQQTVLQPILLEYLPKLCTAAYALKSTAFQLGNGAMGWASGHHPQLQGPESWSTASVFHFVYALGRLVAEAMRRAIFEYLDQEYQQPIESKTARKDFCPKLLDSNIQLPDSEPEPFLDKLWTSFVGPISKATKRVSEGRTLPDDTSTAILFGPPGTAKTELAKEIAKFLGWPLLQVDPSHVVKRGMDMIQAEANVIFGMLETAECLVVLLDEFDELVRDRSSEGTEVLSRLMTTAMLPKISRIHNRKTIVFILATNYIDRFDTAISRLGRFDKVLQVLPPTTAAKLKGFEEVDKKLKEFDIDIGPLDQKLSALTFLEFKRLAAEIVKATSPQALIELINHAFQNCTLQKGSTDSDGAVKDTWQELNEQQRRYVVL